MSKTAFAAILVVALCGLALRHADARALSTVAEAPYSKTAEAPSTAAEAPKYKAAEFPNKAAAVPHKAAAEAPHYKAAAVAPHKTAETPSSKAEEYERAPAPATMAHTDCMVEPNCMVVVPAPMELSVDAPAPTVPQLVKEAAFAPTPFASVALLKRAHAEAPSPVVAATIASTEKTLPAAEVAHLEAAKNTVLAKEKAG